MALQSKPNLFRTARFVADEVEHARLVQGLGFQGNGDIHHFILHTYGKAIAKLHSSDMLRGHMFVLEPALVEGTTAPPDSMLEVIREIKEKETEVLAIRLDLAGGMAVAAAPTVSDLNTRAANGGWRDENAENLSESLQKCVVLANGVGVRVYVCGKTFLELGDAIEGLQRGPQKDFQNESWNYGMILRYFAEQNLNDKLAGGIWRLPEKYILKPRPETDIRRRLYEFLKNRLVGWSNLVEEGHVENEGRLDLALSLCDQRVYLIEIKWIGRALKNAYQNRTDGEVSAAGTTWFTEFDESTIDAGFQQVVTYLATGRFRRGYLAVFDCQHPANALTELDRAIPGDLLAGQDAAKFRIMRLAVDLRTASKRPIRRKRKRC